MSCSGQQIKPCLESEAGVFFWKGQENSYTLVKSIYIYQAQRETVSQGFMHIKKKRAEELTQTTSVSADFHVAPERCSTFRPGPE